MSRKQHSTGAYSTSFNLKQLILLQLFLNGTLIHHSFSLLWESRITVHWSLPALKTRHFFPEIRRLTSLNKNKSPKHDFQKVFNSDLNQIKPIDHRNLLVTQQPIAMGGKRNYFTHNLSWIQQPQINIKKLHQILKL